MRIRTILAATATLSVAGLLVAAPASAAELPAGARIALVDTNSGQYFDVNGATAGLAAIGTATGVEGVSGLDVDETGVGFAVTALEQGAGDLYAADAVTGTLTLLGGVIVFGDVLATNCEGLDYSAGVLLAACNVGDQMVIGELDPETGLLDDAIVTDVADTNYISALAVDPTTGVVYAFGSSRDIFVADLAAGTLTAVAESQYRVGGVDFDVNGTLWVSAETPDGDGLGTLDPVTGAIDFIGEYAVSDGSEYTSSTSLTVWGGTPDAPALAATGAENILPVALGAVFLVIAGLAIAATHGLVRRDSRTH